MTGEPRLVIEPLNPHHDRGGFDCGIASLNRYLQRQAGQDSRRRISRVFVARMPEDEAGILGYYTLSAVSIDLSTLPPDTAGKLPRHPIPAALIGRLAVAEAHHGQRIGSMLLANAIRRTLAVGDEIAIHALVVDAIDERAAAFYARFGFAPLLDDGSRLFLPLRKQ
jgi:GNAT superfamily N-acetyltransferase